MRKLMKIVVLDNEQTDSEEFASESDYANWLWDLKRPDEFREYALEAEIVWAEYDDGTREEFSI